MGKSEISVIAIYISIIASSWIRNGEVMQGLEKKNLLKEIAL